MNLVDSDIISIETDCGSRILSLPHLLALLGGDAVRDFPALRAHQAPTWHAFLVQLAALVTLEQGAVPADEAGWHTALKALTRDWPDDEPWRLVTPPNRPAFLQPAAPDGLAAFTGLVETPDALDVLVTSKNHDLKAERMHPASPEHWLFALLALQTLEGVMGAGKYGILRMNGGYGSRPFMGIVPPGGPGARWRRDVGALIADDGRALFGGSGQLRGDLALLWLRPWDGGRALDVDELHPLAIEVCRRVRLGFAPDGRLFARTAPSKAARVSGKDLRGITGDPWAPIETGKEPKVLSIGAAGFGWRRMKGLLFGQEEGGRTFQRPLLAYARDGDGAAVEVEVAALARGQGKTEGFHRRRVVIPAHRGTRADERQERLARLANAMEHDATEVAGILRRVLFALFQRGAERPKLDRRDTDAQVQPFLRQLDDRIDAAFFPTLFDGAADDAAEERVTEQWRHALRRFALDTFAAAAAAAPRTEARRFLHRASCERRLQGALSRVLPATRPATHPETDDAA